ncbi:DNA recombination protein RmuC [Bacillota bacterium Meth-B3]|nr:DNA recombination protein RmuC [Christensenellaceae bacterium]MEA5065039.1 DNA recombination protein RmuC [Eubacteriales bacterium]MEA5069195.1 DNA recombination protein RmuC [Christensenellaceae bacterium]
MPTIGLDSNLILWLVVGAAALLAVCLLLLLKRAGKRESMLDERLGGVEHRLADQLRLSREQAGEMAKGDREEMSVNLRGMGDSVTRVMGEMSRTQQAQLDAFAAQLRDMGRVDEARMAHLQRGVEERLQSYEERIDRIGGALDDKLERNEYRLERMRETVEQRMVSLQDANDKRLTQMQLAVDERLHQTLDKRLGESFNLVSERLEQVYRGLSEIETLASGVGDLKRVLTGVRSHGLVGEIQLGALLSQLMAREQYEERVVIGGEACDFAIRLPGSGGDGTMYLPIDARFPHEAYYRLLEAEEAGDAQTAQQLSEELTQKLRLAGERVGRQFIAPPLTTDFAVLFLASEGLYAEAIKRGDLAEALQRDHRVMLTGPSTLAALLNSLQMGFKTLAIEKRSEEVWALLGAVRGEFANFADALARTQKRIRQAGESIEDASRKSRAIQRRLKSAPKLDAEAGARLLGGEDEALYDDGDWD